MKKTNNANWISKLTDENIFELANRLTADKATKKFVKIIKTERSDDCINVLYECKKTNSYLTYSEEKLTINDYKINGVHKLSTFVKAMIEFLGEEYAEDFLSHAENYIKENPNDTLAKKYSKVIKDVQNILAVLKNQINSI